MMVLFHCESNPGYAASSHEHTFLDVARNLAGDIQNVHYAYSDLTGGMTSSLPAELTNILHLDTQWSDPDQLRSIESYVRKHRIQRLLGFDQPVSRPMYQALRKGGVKTFVSYWGAPMSSLNSGLKLFLKKLEVSTKRYGPDHYVFQSDGMRDTAVNGRGIPFSKTSIVKTGIDTRKYAPDPSRRWYAHECFDIPRDRKIVVFSGHMERRKGVHVILQAAEILTRKLKQKNVQFLILGNRPGERENFLEYLQDPEVNEHITFGGYRADVPDLLKSCSVGMIASVEWDSFPMSSLEMAATELPLLVSDLPGLNEAVASDTGRKFPVNDHVAAAEQLNTLLNQTELLETMGSKGRERVIKHYSRTAQAKGIINIFRELEREQELVL
ncbi:glycosyltransferase family 4 protein [Marinobacter sp. M216]|uniref:Glycosyltransferase family 4 protein n=1 Tax=Marinobacter albus TaxID=3030833 RepID=A0ABT7HDN4_9GAMM|nr:glycosyltransferase family 4 protein [Marinobacter sp. M216]MDK9557676.1 glycosyltransferase family 4 protein [Marinobacter sp. M216]